MNSVPVAHPGSDLLDAFGLGLLDDSASTVIEQHLAECSTCQVAVDAVPPDRLIVTLRRGKGGPGGQTASGTTEDTQAPQGQPAPAAETVPAELVEHPRYRILEVLGQGGMGAVYRAEHRLMQRPVALKVIRGDLVDRPGMIERFQREVRAAARLIHPNIVTAYDAEQAGAVHFLAMEFVEGTTLARLVEERGSLPIRQACIYARQVAQGLQHACEHGMVHRDIKPQNLLLTPSGWVKILDFGLARFVREHAAPIAGEKGALTAAGVVMGTPDYMAPEQANDAHTADIRADLYSLGCTLYHFLTGAPPFAEGSFAYKLAAHLQQKPRRLMELRADVPPELDAVVQRLLAKDPAQRYQTPAEVVQALTPFLKAPVAAAVAVPEAESSLPSLAPSPGAAAVALPTAPARPRRRRLVLGAALLGLLLLGGIVVYRIATDKGTLVIETDDDAVEVSIKQKGKLVTILDTKTNEKVVLRSGEYVAELSKGAKGLKLVTNRLTIKRGEKTTVKVRFEPAPPGEAPITDSGPGPADKLKREQIPPYELAVAGGGDPKLAPPELVAILGNSRMKHWHEVQAVAFSPDGKVLASSSQDRTVKFWDVRTGDELRTLRGHTRPVEWLAFSPDGKMLASCSADTTAKLWEVATGSCVRNLVGHAGGISHLAYSPDGKLLATASAASYDGTVRLWDVATGDCVWTSPKHTPDTGAVAFSPDGKLLASGNRNGDIHIWRTATRKLATTLKGHKNAVHHTLAFHPDGKILVSGSADHTAKVWDTTTWRELRTLQEHRALVTGVVFSRDGKQLATSSLDGTVILWDGAGKQEQRRFSGHRLENLWGLAFSPDGKTLALGSGDSTVKLWDVSADRPRPLPPGNLHLVYGVTVSADGRRLASGSYDGKVRLWDLAKGGVQETISADGSAATAVALSRDGKWLAWANWSREIHVWDLSARALKHRLRGHTRGVTRVTFGPDSRLLAASGYGSVVKLWDAVTGRELSSLDTQANSVNAIGFSPDGRTLATGGEDNKIRLWDTATGGELQTLEGHARQVRDVAYRPDGRVLASGSADGTARLWDVPRGRERQRLDAGELVDALAFSPDGRTLATASWDGKVRLWDAYTGAPGRTLTLGPPGGIILSLTFTPDGRHLVTGNYNGTIYVLRLRPPQTKRGQKTGGRG